MDEKIKRNLDESRTRLAKAMKKAEQAQHESERLGRVVEYFEGKERRARTHRLITRGAAIESVMPKLKVLSEKDFYSLTESVSALPEVQRLADEAISGYSGEQDCTEA